MRLRTVRGHCIDVCMWSHSSVTGAYMMICCSTIIRRPLNGENTREGSNAWRCAERGVTKYGLIARHFRPLTVTLVLSLSTLHRKISRVGAWMVTMVLPIHLLIR